MNAVTRLRLLFAVASVSLLIGPLVTRAADGPSPAVMGDTSAAVVQVISRDCDDGTRTGSGFLWDSPTQIVTALHVIAGCHNVAAYFKGVAEIPAVVRHTLLNADLALLEVRAQPTTHPLRLSARNPEVNDTLEVIGYYFGVKTLDSRPLHVTLGSQILGDMVTDKARDLLRSSGSPSLNTQILRLDGNLLPGLSGAPLIDADGAVVGVGSGGLENGTVGVSWAIQAHYLNDLRSATLILASPASSHAPLFAAPAAGSDGNRVRCGDFTFANVKTRSLRELLSTADDIPGFIRISATTGLSNDEIQSITYDVYTEQNSGGSVALPKGAHLIQDGAICNAHMADGLEINLGSSKVNSQFDVQNASVAFEASFDAHGLGWIPDPTFSYTMPMTRSDGLIVRRKNFVGINPMNMNMPVADTFETLMSRGSALVNVRVVNTKFNPLAYQQCRLQPAASGCLAVNSFFRTWVAAALGVQMSTFPPS